MSTFFFDLSSNHAGHHNQDQSRPLEATKCSDTDSTHNFVPDIEISTADKEGKVRFQKMITSMDLPPSLFPLTLKPLLCILTRPPVFSVVQIAQEL